MNNPESQEIVARFFQALDILIERGVYNSYYDFSARYAIQRGLVSASRSNHASNTFQMSWIGLLFKFDKVNLEFIFTGYGKPFHGLPKRKARVEKSNRLV